MEYVVNPKTLKTFNAKKQFFLENKRGLRVDGKVKELLLFHGTDSGNLDSIMENNFNIDTVPSHKKKKMIYGRGVYMSEHPEIAFNYGHKLLLCRVRKFLKIASQGTKFNIKNVCRFYQERLKEWSGNKQAEASFQPCTTAER